MNHFKLIKQFCFGFPKLSAKLVANSYRLPTISTKCNKNSVGHESGFIEFRGGWQEEIKLKFQKDMRVFPNFITELEETAILSEIEPYMSRLRYEYDHWDNAIHGFRETERKSWYPQNKTVLQRVQTLAFEGEVMPYIHILDLAEEGVIKPHVDSERYCGNTISGISLLSDSVMRLVYRGQIENSSNDGDSVENFYADLLLPRRSLYIMRDSARYNFTHEILPNAVSNFRGKPVLKKRRISIICRNEPQA